MLHFIAFRARNCLANVSKDHEPGPTLGKKNTSAHAFLSLFLYTASLWRYFFVSFVLSVFFCLGRAGRSNAHSDGGHAENGGIYSAFASLHNILNVPLGFMIV